MTDLPLRSISISDFRRLENTRVLPLDAPIVLLHGHNGAGKTSVLSALELALTGEIRSMRRHDPRYTAHLPFHGYEFATLSVKVSESLGGSDVVQRMTVGSNRIEGNPALHPGAAQFYTERCYLDQVSLGQLLDLYQYREGREESALARFVNELLGLKDLDALELGLADAGDYRRLKRLSEPLANVDQEAQQAEKALVEATSNVGVARADFAAAKASLSEAMRGLGLSIPISNLETARAILTAGPGEEHRAANDSLRQTIAALGGRIEGLSSRPSAIRLEEGRAEFARASAAYRRWREEHGPAMDAWHAEVAQMGFPASLDSQKAIAASAEDADRLIVRQDKLAAEGKQLETRLNESRSSLTTLQNQLADAQEGAGSLAEGLAALRQDASDNRCPVCDRDFSEVSPIHLTVHIDRKLAELTNQGLLLLQLRKQRDAVAAAVQSREDALDQIHRQLLSADELNALRLQRAAFHNLQKRLRELQPEIDTLFRLESSLRTAETTLSELESLATEASEVVDELEAVALQLGIAAPRPDQPLQEVWRQLAEISDERAAKARTLAAAYSNAQKIYEQTQKYKAHIDELVINVAQLAEHKSLLDARVKEAKRRQTVARAVRDAASQARNEIVQRVFTQSLNDVWRSVFTRLAPREYFVPQFGVPTSSKNNLELTLETVHKSGTIGGSPQLMLSAGNLNTAALSLFIALHLAVEPLVPCLVFDDPVQSMDEVHIAQFAGLMRVLSKQHGRQIVIAVHERELFEYLALELSPAFEGDGLITIELGEQPDGTEVGVRRIPWKPDQAIPV